MQHKEKIHFDRNCIPFIHLFMPERNLCGFILPVHFPIFLLFADQISVILVWLLIRGQIGSLLWRQSITLIKGAAGQAVQNMNIICGFEENTGLQNIPLYP